MNPKILLLSTEYGEGGAARVFATHSQDLSPHFEVTECTFVPEPVAVYVTSNSKTALNVPASRSWLESIVNLGKRILRLRAVMQEGRFALCISHMEGANYVNSFSLGPWRKVLIVHGSIVGDRGYQGMKGWMRAHLLLPLACLLADRVIAVSDSIRQDLVGRGVPGHKVVSIPNYFEPEALQDQARAAVPARLEGFFAQHRVICHMARLSAQKNQKSLLKLLSFLKRCGPYRLVFVGSGGLQAELVSYAHSLGLSVCARPDADPGGADVLFVGYQPNPFPFLARSCLSVLTSWSEGFPLSLCESMCCRIPVAAVDCPTGPRQIFGAEQVDTLPDITECGILLPDLEDRHDHGRFLQCAEVIHHFLEDAEKVERVTRQALARVKRLYSREVVLNSLLELIARETSRA